MKHSLEFHTDKDIASSIEIIKKYFLKQGFSISAETEESLSFNRGNAFLNFITFDPLEWKSNIHIEFEKQTVFADFEVNRVGQMVSKNELELWKAFRANFQKTVETGELQIKAVKEVAKSSNKRSLKFYVAGVFGANLFGAISFALIEQTKMTNLHLFLVPIGFLLFFQIMIKIDAKNSPN